MANFETNVGITHYVNNHCGFFGIIKQRFSDFIVNEISSSGKVIHLTSKEIIKPPEQSFQKNINKPIIISDDHIEIFKVISGQNLLKPSICMKLNDKDIIEKKAEGISSLKINVEGASKELRTTMHHFIKTNFTNLNSTTKEFDNKKFIHITKKENIPKKERRNEWPKSSSYVHFVLYKENVDTMEAINLIARNLRLKSNLFCYAGTKDRRAKTSQLVSVYQVSPHKLQSATKCLKGIHVGNFTFNHKPQKLGQLQGNHFTIVLREVRGSSNEIETAVLSLKNEGFINYYGMQRFSCVDAPTHAIGKALISCDWNKVIDQILCPRKNDAADLTKAKEIWNSKRDAHLALKALKPFRRSSPEGLLLTGLAVHGNTDIVNALEKIPRNTRMMYLHAYQSYIWNIVVSKRVEKYGLTVLVGDIIRKNIKGNVDKTGLEGEDNDDENISSLEVSRKDIYVLQQKDIHTIDITEIIMPLPGFDIIYPENETKTWYEELLKKDGININNFTHKVKGYSLSGAYRHMIVRPLSLSHKLCYYEEPTKPLVPSDLDLLENISVEENILSEFLIPLYLKELEAEYGVGRFKTQSETDCFFKLAEFLQVIAPLDLAESHGLYKSLILDLSLPPSSYATMALRELLKMQTSSEFQSTLNKMNDNTKEIDQLESRDCKFINVPEDDRYSPSEKKIKLDT